MSPVPLTPRQKEIAEYVARGMSSKAIAETTGLKINTVNVHIRAAAERINGDGPPRYRLTVHILVLNAPEPRD